MFYISNDFPIEKRNDSLIRGV